MALTPYPAHLEDLVMTAEELRKKRLQLGLTQSQFAKMIQMSLRQVCRWEAGDFPVPKVIALAMATLLRESSEGDES